MARRKETIWQNDFSLGAVRPEAEERDDTPLVTQSCREMLNTRTLTTGQIEGRPGTLYLNSTDAQGGVEVDLGQERVFDLHIVPSGIVLRDEANTIEYTGNLTWTAAPAKFGTFAFDDISFWVLADPDASSILIGSQFFPIQALILGTDGSWGFGQMDFSLGLSGAIQQPYWRYNEDVTIAPSARTGSITVTASSNLWTAAHDGVAVRYLDREIILGTLISPTVINAMVTEELPPTYAIGVASSSNYQVGDAVEQSILGGQGIITEISGTTITVLATSSYDGFDTVASPKLVAPNAAQGITSVVPASSPAATYLWDIQMQSPVHGYAGYAARHTARLILCDYPGAPQGFAVSVPNAINDFKMGPNDADGFVEAVGADSGGALKFIVSVEDLIFMTTKGLYFQQTRDGTALTPKTIRPVRFSRIGCADVEPVAVDDGCVFVNSVGQQVYTATLAGDVYKKWKAETLTKYHPHLVKNPVQLGATSSGSEDAENYVYVVNGDGSAAVCQWDRENQSVSWRPWQTDGNFRSIYQCFGKIHAIVDRQIADKPVRFRERFERGLVMDCVAALKLSPEFSEGEVGVEIDQGKTGLATHLTGHLATVFLEGWDMGDNLVNAFGRPEVSPGQEISYPAIFGIVQVGLIFKKRITPWARKSIHTQRGVKSVKRLICMFISVQETTAFEIGGEAHGAYRAGEDLTAPPPRRNEQFKSVPVGKTGAETLDITQDRPGFLRITKLGYRVVI
ncbi:MAG: hypothetical protein JKX76_00635 [Colwellia sp.]|nr:hypothetical protein [Colwellia sp.]